MADSRVSVASRFLKKCILCHKVKRFQQFYVYRRSKDGRSVRCRSCRIRSKRFKLKRWQRLDIRGKKRCGACNRIKPFRNFFRNRSTRDGYQCYCKPCFTGYALAEYKKKRAFYCARARERNRELRMKALSHYGGSPPKCACCGEGHLEFLALDHIHGRRGVARSVLVGGVDATRWAKRNGWPAVFRVLCHNCNHAGGVCGYCPHNNPSVVFPPRLRFLEREREFTRKHKLRP